MTYWWSLLLLCFPTASYRIKCFTHFASRSVFTCSLCQHLYGEWFSSSNFQVGGSILAAKLAKERGWAINIGGGFHHCSAEKGGGFCAYADISLCIQFAFVLLNISR
ncbi:hypothetical protein GW17_00031850 [Ensete ventricosum]|nr:hypothetical protein GW17_00031850 [Ensete ventricosum]